MFCMEAILQDGSEPSASLRMDGMMPTSVQGADFAGMGSDVTHNVSDKRCASSIIDLVDEASPGRG